MKVLLFFLILVLFSCGCFTHSVSQDELSVRLQKEKLEGVILEKDQNGLYSLDLSRTACDYSFLNGLQIKKINLYKSNISDLSMLHDMPLEWLAVNRTKVVSLEGLQGLPLEVLVISETLVDDLSPLCGMNLKYLVFEPNKVVKGLDIIRNMKSLKSINGLPAATFWKLYDGDATNRTYGYWGPSKLMEGTRGIPMGIGRGVADSVVKGQNGQSTHCVNSTNSTPKKTNKIQP